MSGTEQKPEFAAVAYDGPTGNVVFNAGTCWWSMVLSTPPGFANPPGRDFTRDDPRVQRITKNLLARMIGTETRAIMSRMKLTGKRALVTAGAQGIGLAISRGLAAAGCDVFVHYRSSREAAEALCAELQATGGRAAGGAGDLTDAGECRRVVDEAAAFLGGLDVLINNAGSLVARRKFEEADDAFWDEVMRLNLDSARWVTHAALTHLVEAGATRGGASIVNLSSVAGRHGGGPGAIAYSTSKGAVLTLTRGLATGYAPKGVRINAVTPGLILGSAFHDQHTPEEMQQNGSLPASLWVARGRPRTSRAPSSTSPASSMASSPARRSTSTAACT